MTERKQIADGYDSVLDYMNRAVYELKGKLLQYENGYDINRSELTRAFKKHIKLIEDELEYAER